MEPKNTVEEKKACSVNDAGKSGKLHAKEWNYTAIFYHIPKFTQNFISFKKIMLFLSLTRESPHGAIRKSYSIPIRIFSPS